ncbi:hypothetical protein DFH09DRAFT_1100892 [Mycena vulgaris]|nr:hypothetical protein DFH09DRAFT_1100892 [Mycena vulgaris]
MSSSKNSPAANTGPENEGPWFLVTWGLMSENSERIFNMQEADRPYFGLYTDPSDTPTYASRNFSGILKFLPRCVGSGMCTPGTPKGLDEVFDDPMVAERRYRQNGNKAGGIYVTDSTEDADVICDLAYPVISHQHPSMKYKTPGYVLPTGSANTYVEACLAPFFPSPKFTTVSEHDYHGARQYHLITNADREMKLYSDVPGARFGGGVDRNGAQPGFEYKAFQTAREVSVACLTYCRTHHKHDPVELVRFKLCTEGLSPPIRPADYIVVPDKRPRATSSLSICSAECMELETSDTNAQPGPSNTSNAQPVSLPSTSQPKPQSQRAQLPRSAKHSGPNEQVFSFVKDKSIPPAPERRAAHTTTDYTTQSSPPDCATERRTAPATTSSVAAIADINSKAEDGSRKRKAAYFVLSDGGIFSDPQEAEVEAKKCCITKVHMVSSFAEASAWVRGLDNK